MPIRLQPAEEGRHEIARDHQFADRPAERSADVRVAFERHDRVHDEFDRQQRVCGVLLGEERMHAFEIVQGPRRVEDPRHRSGAPGQRRGRARRTGVGRRTVRPCARPTMYAWTSSAA
jgi:hypothetical protein